MAVCEKCKGEKVIRTPIASGYYEEEPCDLCGGTGKLPEPEKDVLTVLEEIRDLLKGISRRLPDEPK